MACCLPTCAQGSSVPVMVNALYCVFLFCFLVSPWCLVRMGSPSLAGLPVVYKTWVIQVGGSITFVTSGRNTYTFIKLPTCIFGYGGDL